MEITVFNDEQAEPVVTGATEPEDYQVQVTYLNAAGQRRTHQEWIMAETQADAWPQGLEIANALAGEAGGALINIRVSRVG